MSLHNDADTTVVLVFQSEVSYYCLTQTAGNGTTPSICEEATQAEIDLLTSSMAACFRTAVDAGMDLALSPHLDDGLGLGMTVIPRLSPLLIAHRCHRTVERSLACLKPPQVSRS